jgi:hypothetical protein
LTVLFGTVKYFERELLSHLKNRQEFEVGALDNIYLSLRVEVLNNFVCDEVIRERFLENLFSAFNDLKIGI